MYEMLFPCQSGLSAYRNLQDLLLALYALLLETTESHLFLVYRGAIYEENLFRSRFFCENDWQQTCVRPAVPDK